VTTPLPTELVRAYLTRDAAPLSGETRALPEDFLVEELPLYEPSGEGEHLYVRIEKRGIPTPEAVRRMARALHVQAREVGYAGLKDAHAVTRQTLSFQHVDASALERFSDPQVRVLSVSRHKNKLKLGHLRGNRFTIVRRGTKPEDEPSARATLERLARSGAPNYFGLQRFGLRLSSHRLGLALVREDHGAFLRELLGGPSDDDAPPVREVRAAVDEGWARGTFPTGLASRLPASFEAERAALASLERGSGDLSRAVRAVPIRWRSLYTSALQSVLFNRYVTERLDRLGCVEGGEIAFLHRNGAAFLVENVEAEQLRVDTLEISPSGPMFGAKLLRPREGSSTRTLEDAILADWKLASPDLGPACGASPQGERRALRVLPLEPVVRREGTELVLTFTLGKGCYATTILEELLKRPVA
jgi:tRNA pseudouridine13 synthase